MATNTTYYNLSKPAYADIADIAVINSNMDKIDTALNTIAGRLLTAKDGIDIPSGSNLDNYNNNGIYKISSAAIAETISNMPVALSGRLVCFTTTSGVDTNFNNGFQIYYGNSATSSNVYFRHRTSGTWLPWEKFARISDVYLPYYKVGETYSTEQFLAGASGYVSGAAKSAVIDVPVPIIGTVASISITSLKVSMRIVSGGYLGGAENYDATSLSPAASYIQQVNRQGIMRIVIQKDSGWGITNNTPMCGEVKMKFSIS